MHEVDLLPGGLHGVLARERAGHVHGPELAGDTAGREPREVGLHRRLTADEVHSREVVPAVLAQRPRQVVVAVDDTDGVRGAHRLRVTGVLGRDRGIHKV